MSDPQSRRRRQPMPPSRSSAGGTGGSGGGPLPMAALIVGIIVAGLGIGALVSAFQNRGTQPLPELGATSLPLVTPVPQPSAPQPVLTLPPTPSPVPTASPSPAATNTVRATAAPSVTPAAAKPSPSASPSASAAPSPSARPSAAATKAVALVVTPSPAPTSHPTLAATVRPTVTPNPGDAALALIRRYLDDLIAGDEAGAYSALSDRSLGLKEEAFLDKDARITAMHVARSDATGTTIDAEITSSHGSYVATYHVVSGPSGSIINQHDYIKI